MTSSCDTGINGSSHTLNAFKDLTLFLFLENMIDSVLYTCRMPLTWCQIYPIQKKNNNKLKGRIFSCGSQNYADIEI